MISLVVYSIFLKFVSGGFGIVLNDLEDPCKEFLEIGEEIEIIVLALFVLALCKKICFYAKELTDIRKLLDVQNILWKLKSHFL